MVTFTYTIRQRQGLHARPVAMICAFANSYEGTVRVSTPTRTVLATDVMGVMGMDARQGDELRFTIDGKDEQSAAMHLRSILESHL